MKILICLLFMISIFTSIFTQVAFGTVLHRYTDIATGEERGICYSSKDNIPAISNPDWTVEVIEESQKEFYMNEHRKQIKAREKVIKDNLKAKKKVIKDKLKAGTPLSQQDVDLLVGESN